MADPREVLPWVIEAREPRYGYWYELTYTRAKTMDEARMLLDQALRDHTALLNPMAELRFAKRAGDSNHG